MNCKWNGFIQGRGTTRSWNLYSNIIMEVRTPGGKKNKIETGRPLFPRPRILVKISRTLGGTGIENIHIRPLWWSLGPPSRSKLDDSSGLKGYCKTTHSRPIPLFFQTFFFLPSLPSWDPRDAVTTRWFFFENKFVYVIDWTGDDNCIIQQYFISDPRYSFLSVHGDPVFVSVCNKYFNRGLGKYRS